MELGSEHVKGRKKATSVATTVSQGGNFSLILIIGGSGEGDGDGDGGGGSNGRGQC